MKTVSSTASRSVLGEFVFFLFFFFFLSYSGVYQKVADKKKIVPGLP